ncbi:DUF2809 domain-containing protein [Dactylosporangium sp. NPDC000555]|uniref:ribosomal maturation YjgA family protein n=1 Tax=Dactylosporangium sp. NPDC000555 TaxID=3154260 RepID=UPI00332434B2
MPLTTRAIRLAMVALAVLALAVALGIRAASGTVLESANDLEQYSGTALYASMVYAGVVFLRPRTAAWAAGTAAIGFCWAVELFQLTGVPATLSAHSVVARLALGVAFDPTDLLWYPVGVVPLVVLDRLLNLRRTA